MNEKAKDDLKDCPLCGGKARLVIDGTNVSVICTKCGCQIPTVRSAYMNTSKVLAMDTWNSRAGGKKDADN